MPLRDHALRGVRMVHRAGAWVFDHSGPAAPALAKLGEPLHRRLFPHSMLTDPGVPIVVDGLRLYHEGRPSYHLQMLAMGMHDRDVAALIHLVGRPGMAVLDIGAHLGYFTLLCSRLGGVGSMVWAFEPSPTLNPILRRNIIENGAAADVRVVPAAVGDKVGMVTLFAGTDDSMLSSLYPTAAAHESQPMRADSVPCTTLDAWADREGWPRIDLIKIDVEGHEVAVLTGMRALARRNPGLAVIVELNERTLAATGHTVDTFWEALVACGLDSVYLAGMRPRRVSFAEDWRIIQREIRRQGNGRVNLLCRRET